MRLSTVFVLLMAFAVIGNADPRLWDPNGVPVFQNGRVEWSGSTSRDTNGMTVTTWSDLHTGSREIYAQLINPAGQTLWGNGVQLTNDPHEQSQPQVVATNGGWIVAWIDYRNVPLGQTHREEGGHIYMQKLDNDGNPLWVPGGVCIDSSYNTRVRWGKFEMVSDHAGGAMIAAAILTSSWQIYSYRFTDAGAIAWPCLTITTSGDSPLMNIVSDDAGGIVVAWQGEAQNGMLATRVCADGSTPWGRYSRIGTWSISPVSLAPDGEGGFYAAWQSSMAPNYDRNIYAQHVNASGQPSWSTDGVLVCNVSGTQSNPVLAASFDGGSRDGCVIVWNDARISSRPDVYYTQKLGPSGVALWDSNGIVLCDSVRNNRNMALTSDSAGGFVAAWEDLRGMDPVYQVGGQDIGALHLNANGQRLWNGDIVPVCTGARDQFLPVLVPENGAYLVLYQNGDRIAYDDSVITGFSLQKLNALSGTRQFSDSGMVLTNYPVRAASGLCAAPMSDYRTALLWNSNGNHYQILDREGHCTLNSDTAIIRCDIAQLIPDITLVSPDGEGGVFAILDAYDYANYREDGFLARITPEGHLVNNGQARRLLPVGNELGTYSNAVCPDGEGGCYATVERILGESLRDDIWGNLYLTRWDADCRPLWQTPVLLDTMIDMFGPISLIPHPQGGCVVERYSYGCGEMLTYFGPAGTVVWNVCLSDSFSNGRNHRTVAAGQSGFYLTVSGDPDFHRPVCAQRVSLDGQIVWPQNGIALNPSSTGWDRACPAADSSGNLIVTWVNSSLYAQKLSPAGTLLWGNEPRVVSQELPGPDYPIVIPDGSDGTFFVWDHYDMVESVYGTHLTADGMPGPDPYWVLNEGGLLCDSTAVESYNNLLMVPAGNGEAVVVWMQDLQQSQVEDQGLYAQRIAASSLGAKNRPSSLPSRYALYQNYPNPFNPTTLIQFDLARAGMTKLTVFNVLGREVTTLVNRNLAAGQHRVELDASDLSSGVYFYRLQSGSFTSTKKMIVLK